MDHNIVSVRKTNFPIVLNRNSSSVIRKKNYIINVFVSFLIYSLTFSFFHFLKKQTVYFDIDSLKLLGFFIISIITGAVLSQKFNLTKLDEAEETLKKLYLSVVISLGALITLLHLFEIPLIIPFYILGAMFSGLVIESYYFMMISKYKKGNISLVEHKKLSVRYLILDGLILTFFCYVYIASNLIPANFNEKEFLLLSIIYISWLISAATTHKFIPVVVSNNRWNAFELQVKFYIRIIALVALSMIFLKLEVSSSVYFIKALVGYSIVSSFISMFLFAEKVKNKTDEATVVFLKAYEMNDPVVRSKVNNGNGGKYSFDKKEESDSVVKQKLQFEYLKEFGEVFSVLDTMLDLKSFDTRRSLIIKSDEPNDMTSHPPESYQLVANLHVLNDQIKLNDYILDVRKSLVGGGSICWGFTATSLQI